MTTVSIPLSVISIQHAKPTTKFGLTATFPLSNVTTAEASALVRCTFAQIPDGAIITSAILTFTNHTAWSGARTVKADRNTVAGVSSSRTWGTKPTTTTTDEATQTQTGLAALGLWQLDITAMVQGWVAGTYPNYGLTLSTTSTTVGTLRGTNAASGAPVLVVTYTTAPTTPSGLHPSGNAVSLSKPTLSFQVASDTVSVQVQVDPAANAGAPAFDSGEIPSTSGIVDLTKTYAGGTYGGLSNGASTQWRARAKNAQGWSAWSSWVTFSRTTWGTLAITSPGTTSEDPSPSITGTYSGTVTAWRAWTTDSLGAVMSDSGWTAGNAMAFGTTKSVGSAGTAWLSIRDNVLREATPGDPAELTVSKAFTVTPSGTPAVVTGLTASQTFPKPAVHLAGSRGSIPDEVLIYRGATLVDRVPGAGVFTGSGPYAFAYDDVTAPMNTSASYTVVAVSNGSFSNPSAAAVITPTCQGIWLYDIANGTAAALWGDDEQEQTETELAIVHQPVSGPGGVTQVVRRRLARYPRAGTLTGTLFDALGVSVATSEANLRTWITQDAGHLYRLVMGNANDQVILGDITPSEVSVNRAGQRVVVVTVSWWRQG